MAKPIRFTPKNSASGWRINIPAKISETGKRQQIFYRTQKLALAAADDLKKKVELFGVQTRAIAPTVAEQATAALRLLEPLGIGLLEAVQRFVAAENRNRASVPIETAIADFRAAGGDPIDEQAGKPKKNNGSIWSDSQATAYRLRGEKLIEAFTERMISTITGEELRKHLEATCGGPGSFNQGLRLVRAIWRWSAKPPRKWCDLEAVEHLEMQDSVSSEIGVLSHAQALAVMRAAETYFPAAVPGFAIALFTGMRRDEIARLSPEDVTSEGITLPAVSAKTKRRRFIQMPEPLAAWLKRYPIGESVTPPDWKRKQIAVRRLAGFKVWSNLVPRLKITPPLEAKPPADLPEWPDNALRHTAATVALALGKPLEQLVFEHGHAGGLEMLRRHYIGALPKSEALKIWAIRPAPKAKRQGKKASRLRVCVKIPAMEAVA
jgi:integrase